MGRQALLNDSAGSVKELEEVVNAYLASSISDLEFTDLPYLRKRGQAIVAVLLVPEHYNFLCSAAKCNPAVDGRTAESEGQQPDRY